MPSPVARLFRAALLAALVLAMLVCGLAVLAVAGSETGPVAFGLAVGLAVLPVPVYLAVVLFIDRYEPEPVRMVALTFAWGATIAAFVAIVLNTVGEVVVSESLGADAAELYGYSISAPIVEESAKGFVLFGIFWLFRREFNGVVDGIVYAALVGLGFAMTENVLYYGRGAVEDGIPGAVGTFVVRGLLSPFAHPIFTAMTGIGLGVATVARSPFVRTVAPLIGLGLAMALHSLWNTSAGSGLFFGVYVLIFVPVLGAIGIIVVLGLRREGRVIARQLNGVLPPGEVVALSSLRARRAWRREAARRGGRQAKKAMIDLQHAAAEVAFLREQVERGTVPRSPATLAREASLATVVTQRRHQLTSLTG
ncbi:MAG TPA: PrsW family intramembrane metalloprotease [Solirubrobacteraceae bacterium]|nr:PrsW family intramembrane metalloprotease [Solirubrobacteraceae bacterium]